MDNLDQLITSNLDNSAIANILETTLATAFNSVEQIEQKSLFHALSLKLHSDKANSAACLKVLNEKGLTNLASTTLNTLWADIQKSNEIPDRPSPFYNPLKYVENVQNEWSKMAAEIISKANQQQKIDLDAILEAHFPELYRYQQYPTPIQTIVYTIAAAINTVLCATFAIKMLANVLPDLIHSIEATLLSLATKNHYARHEAELLAMKQILVQNQTQIDSLTDEEIQSAFDTLYVNTTASKRSYLEALQQNIDDLSDQEMTLFFQKLFVANTIVQLSQRCPSILNNVDVSNLHNQLKDIDVNNIPAIMNCYESLSDEAIEAIYNVLKTAELAPFESLKSMLKNSAFRGTQHLSLIAKALYEVRLEEASVIERLMQGLIIIATLPLTVAGFAWDMFSGFVNVACILLKAASVALINAPLDIHAYFTPEPALQLTNPPVNPEQCNSAAVGVHGLFALQHKLEERAIAQSSMANVL